MSDPDSHSMADWPDNLKKPWEPGLLSRACGKLTLPSALCVLALLLGACTHAVHQHDQSSQVEQNLQEEEEPDCCSLQLPGE